MNKFNGVSMKKLILIVCGLLIFSSTNANAEWIEVGETRNAVFFIDPTTLKKERNLVKIWTMRDLKEIAFSSTANVSYLSDRTYAEFNCKEEKYRQLNFYWYSENKGGGQVVFISDTPSKSIQIPPGSITSIIMKAVCK
jgi:hypothetical protein